MFRKIQLLFLLLLGTLAVDAQEVQVRTFKELSTDISARTSQRFDLNDNPCALIKVQCSESGATFEGFVVGEAELKGNEYWVYVSEGAKRLKMHIPGYDTIELVFSDFGITKVVGKTTYVVQLKLPSSFKFSMYAEAGFLAGTGTMGPEIAVGAYFGGFNLELDARLPISGGETGYWQSDTQVPLEFTYKPGLSFGGRLGYGIMVGEKLRITPQVGLMYMGVTESAVSDTELTPAKGANCASLAVGAKLQYMLSNHIGISLTPEYDAAIAKSKGFKALSEHSSTIKKWNNGIGAKIAVSFEF